MRRSFWVLLHRYAGLYVAAHLILVGVAGCLVAFYDDLDRFFARELRLVEPRGARLDPTTLAQLAEEIEPRGRVTDFSLRFAPDDSFMARIEPRLDPRSNQPYALDFNELYIDPYSGTELGRRSFANLSQGAINLAPFIYRFHYSFMLGELGLKLLGAAALIWTLNCLIGFYLTLPPPFQRNSRPLGRGRNWLSRWKPAWRIAVGGGAARRNFDIHRATGLWLWPVLLLFAWSCVSFNLREEVYLPLMRVFLQHRNMQDAPSPLMITKAPPMGWSAALGRGRTLAREQGDEQGFSIEFETFLMLDPARREYSYFVRSSRDVSYDGGQTVIRYGADTGELIAVELPSGQFAGDTVASWLTALHTGRLFGPGCRYFVGVLGALVVALSTTGVLVWRRKRATRRP